MLDLQYAIACEHLWCWRNPYAEVSEVDHILTPAFKNNLVALRSSILSTQYGLYSHARPILRLAFESLILAKYCSQNTESEIFDKWVDGKIVYFTNGVLNKIEEPCSSVFKTFWNLTSSFSHSSPYAMQPDVCIENVEDEITFNFVLMKMLSECNYHLLLSHLLTPSIKYYQKEYSSDSNRVKIMKDDIRGSFSNIRKPLNKEAKKFIKTYKSTWKLKDV